MIDTDLRGGGPSVLERSVQIGSAPASAHAAMGPTASSPRSATIQFSEGAPQTQDLGLGVWA